MTAHSQTHMITYTKNEPHKRPAYYTCFSDGKFLGAIGQEVDGFWYFYPLGEGGFWSSAMAKDLGMKLEALNAHWVDRLKEEGVT